MSLDLRAGPGTRWCPPTSCVRECRDPKPSGREYPAGERRREGLIKHPLCARLPSPAGLATQARKRSPRLQSWGCRDSAKERAPSWRPRLGRAAPREGGSGSTWHTAPRSTWGLGPGATAHDLFDSCVLDTSALGPVLVPTRTGRGHSGAARCVPGPRRLLQTGPDSSWALRGCGGRRGSPVLAWPGTPESG